MGFKPLHDWVLIKRSEPEERTRGGIIVPDAAKTKPMEGVVISAGPGRYRQEKGKKEKKFVPTVLKPGQRIMFVEYMAKDVTLNGEEITLIREDDVLGTIEYSNEVVVRKPHHLEVKKDGPLVPQESSGITSVPPVKKRTSTAAQKKGKAAAPVRKPATKEPKTKALKAPKKASGAPVKKERGKTTQKTAAAKPSQKVSAKKPAVKKAAAVKSAARSKAGKKTVAKKTSSSGKSGKKTGAKAKK